MFGDFSFLWQTFLATLKSILFLYIQEIKKISNHISKSHIFNHKLIREKELHYGLRNVLFKKDHARQPDQ